MSRERELLERTIEEWDSDRDLYEFHKVIEEIRVYLAEPEVKLEEIVTDLIQALETMLVATTKTNEEQFVGHHAAYLETVAKPRAKAALDKARNET